MSFLKNIIKEISGGKAKSLNSQYLNTYLSMNIKVVIVGTITPWDKSGNQYNFYYTSPRNNMYKILDAYFKSNLSDNKNEKDLLLNFIKKHSVAFLDVINTCNKGKTNKDNDLSNIKLDYTSFKKMESKNNRLIYIANSMNAYFALIKIATKVNIDIKRIKYLSIFYKYNQNDWDIELFKAGI